MRQASKRIPDSAEKTVRDIRRATRRHHSAEEKIRIVLEGLVVILMIYADLSTRGQLNKKNYNFRWQPGLFAGRGYVVGNPQPRHSAAPDIRWICRKDSPFSAPRWQGAYYLL